MSIGVLIGNLGTPRSTSVGDVKKYLREFLMDPFVINKPTFLRWILVNALIVPLRGARSARAYQKAWMPEGSPLFVFSQRLQKEVQKKLGGDFKVSLGMRYGEPSLSEALTELKDCSQIILFPQYPQYAQSSYQTWLDEAMKAADELGLKEKIKIIEPFFKDENYLRAQAQSIATALQKEKVPADFVLFSFHGLPESHLQNGPRAKNHNCFVSSCLTELTEDNKWCYRAECYVVARQIAQRLSLSETQWGVSFQSRLGPEPWISPFTDQVIPKLAKEYLNLAVVMPAFTADCLETLEEIGIEAKKEFLQAGGKNFVAVPCMNDQTVWVESMTEMVKNIL